MGCQANTAMTKNTKILFYFRPWLWPVPQNRPFTMYWRNPRTVLVMNEVVVMLLILIPKIFIVLMFQHMKKLFMMKKKEQNVLLHSPKSVSLNQNRFARPLLLLNVT